MFNNSPITTFDKIASLGNLYKTYRKAIGLSQEDVHKKTGVALSTLSLFENGKGQGLSLNHFFLLLDALGLDIDNEVLIPIVSRTNFAKMWKEQNKTRKQ